MDQLRSTPDPITARPDPIEEQGIGTETEERTTIKIFNLKNATYHDRQSSHPADRRPYLYILYICLYNSNN